MKPPIEFFCVETFAGAKSNFVPKGISIGFEMAGKKIYRQTGSHFCIDISRDWTID